jgi:hypothetical protein
MGIEKLVGLRIQGLDVITDLASSLGLAQFQQSPGFDLTHPFAGEVHVFADLSESSGSVVF